MTVSTATLRNFAFSRSLGIKTNLQQAICALGFVQADPDPIRAPARAQDLILMQRVRGYKADDLELHYAALDVEEDMMHNYGFMPRAVQRLLHPREAEMLKITHDIPDLSDRVLEYGRIHARCPYRAAASLACDKVGVSCRAVELREATGIQAPFYHEVSVIGLQYGFLRLDHKQSRQTWCIGSW
jgi:uncharacterized protein YcaQ